MRLAVSLLFAVAGCLRSTAFPCASDTECGAGTCEGVGFCSFADATCTSGARFGEHSGQYAGQCVGDQTSDGGVDDGPAIDGPEVDAFVGCTAGYAALTGGQVGHRYKLRTSVVGWDAHRTACAGEGGYLGIPNDALELQAMVTLGGAAIYVGISDLAAEGAWADVLNGVATFLPWASGQPDDDKPGEDCVRASGITFTDERCSRTARAVCECVE
ncbi:MAG: lectin-like protein [Kofleriaceae bacterium]